MEEIPDAKATPVNLPTSSINLRINERHIRLSEGDCIKFTRIDQDGNLHPNTIAKIIRFGWREHDIHINRVFILPWIPGTPGGWLSSAIPGRWAPPPQNQFIALSLEYRRDNNNIGDWRTIVALPNCPDEAPRAPAIVHTTGGRRRNRKNKRKTRKHRRH